MIERIKSWSLSLLVVVSVILTYQTWTFQPEYEAFEDTTYVENEPVGETRSLSEAVWPEQIVLHQDEDMAAIESNDEAFTEFYETLQDSRIENLVNLTSSGEAGNEVNEIIENNGGEMAEVIFPTPIAGELIEELFQIEEDTPYSSIETLDRMYLVDDGPDADSLKILLVSYQDGGSVFEAQTNFSLSDFRSQYLNNLNAFPSVFALETPEQSGIERSIYLPEDTSTYSTVSYTTSEIATDNFLRLLFNEPNYVEQYQEDNGQLSYTDGSRMVNIASDGDSFNYVNPIYGESVESNQGNVITSSFDFVNSQGGWTDQYRLYDINSAANQEEATYRMIVQGVPVYDTGEPQTSITAVKTGGQIANYSRPLFELDANPIDIEENVTLESGRDIVDQMQGQFDMEEVENVRIGYSVNKDNEVVNFDPSWFIKYGGDWYPFDAAVEEEEE
ncbi:regulatory protein YycH of two-component signal transduction system YycFG [Sinobaca qinghaiensis]|uniref:Regulatory protein YycH of two-component signal transduction system YycFG n=1 Tax=Sinobaca qinghaiensis TaxID=342944 RepID=A0A419UUF0_9BACL|nr:two-component system activity regulator YycH [Sinobaca qinghaiensis]RKD68108.1 regulatory protein YycH of two-component signal transduction system YycFG [Sinobaca qinghaiensis]